MNGSFTNGPPDGEAVESVLDQLANHVITEPNVPQTPAPPPQSLEIAAQHLEATADHLQAVAGQLEAKAAQLNEQAATTLPVSAPAAPAAPSLSSELAIPSTLFAIVALCLVLFESLQAGTKSLTWMTLLAMNVLGIAGFNIMLRRSAWKDVDPWVTATVLQTGLALPWIIKEILSPIPFPHFTPFEIAIMTLGGALIILLQYCNVKGLRDLEASVFAVIFNSRILIATIFSMLFLSEIVGLWALLGGLCIFAAIFIVKQKGTRSITTQGILYGLGAAFAISLMNTCDKELVKLVGFEQYALPEWIIAAAAMWLVVLIRRPAAPYGLMFRPQGLIIMILRAFAGFGFVAALMYGPLAVSSYVSSLSVILTILIGMLFLGERDFLRSKLVAAGVALAGLSFILIDRLR